MKITLKDGSVMEFEQEMSVSLMLQQINQRRSCKSSNICRSQTEKL